ncbi:hypothetical protein OC835_002393 [Tilletia horrida]|nr:hypothetical protein OC835_002393 [Tilletia horrida]
MSGKGGKAQETQSKSTTRSAKAGLQFPVGRIHRLLRNGNYAQRVGAGAPVYLAAVLEYLAAEILELAGNAARDNKKSRIIPRHLQLAIRNDEELNKLLGSVTISQGGVLPFIQSELLPAKSGKKGKTQSSQDLSKTTSTSTSSLNLRWLPQLARSRTQIATFHKLARFFTRTQAASMLSSLRVLVTPSSDTPSQCFPVVLLHFDKARYIFNTPESTVRAFGQHRVPYANIRTAFLASTASAASAGLPGWLITLAEVGHRTVSVHGPIGLKHYIATMRNYVRKSNRELVVREFDPRPPALFPSLPEPQPSRAPLPPQAHGQGLASPNNKGKGKAAAEDVPGAYSSSAPDSAAPAETPFYSDNYIDVYAVPLLPRDFVLSPPAPNNDPMWSSTLPKECQAGRQDENGVQGFEDGDTAESYKRQRVDASGATIPDNDSIFDLPVERKFFHPSRHLTPGSPHAEQWVNALASQIFLNSFAHTAQSRAEARVADMPGHKRMARICGPPIQPSMVPMPTEDEPPSSTPNAFEASHQPMSPLILSYILRGKRQRGVFDADTASIGHGVSPGFLFSLLAEGKAVNIDRPKKWAEWTEPQRKAWFIHRKKIGNTRAPSKKQSSRDKWADAYDFTGVELEKITVLPEQVLGPSRPGPVVIMLHVPSPAYIDSLVSDENRKHFATLFKDTEDADATSIVLVHTGPINVLTDPRYVAFLEQFDGKRGDSRLGSRSASPGHASNSEAPETPAPMRRDVTHILTDAALCADTLGFPSSNLLHLRCSQLDDKIFQVPEYSLKPAEALESHLFKREPGVTNWSWPQEWRTKTHVAYPDMEMTLYPRHRTPDGLPPQPYRNLHGAPVWDFYAGPQKDRQTDEDREKAARAAAFEEPVPEGDSSATAAGNADDASKKLSKKERKKAAAAAAAAAGADGAPENGSRNDSGAKLKQPPADAPRPSSSSQVSTEIEEKKRQAREAKQAAWTKFQELAASIKLEIKAEEARGFDPASPSYAQLLRLAEEGEGVVITPLGTGSAMPSKYRNVSSTLIQFPRPPGVPESEPAPCVLLDAGEGTYGQLRRKFGKEGVDQILLGLKLFFVSHIHADHHIGVSRVLIERRKLAHRARHPLFLICNFLTKSYLEEYDVSEPLGLAPPFFDEAELEIRIQRVKIGIPLEDVCLDHITEADLRQSNLVYLLSSHLFEGSKSVALGEEGAREWEWTVLHGRPDRQTRVPSYQNSNRRNEANYYLPQRENWSYNDEAARKSIDRRRPERAVAAKLLPVLLDSLHLESVETVAVDHGTQHCYGIVVRQRPLPVSKTSTASGSTAAEVNSATDISASEPTNEPIIRPGFSFAYSGDTRPWEPFAQASKGVTLMIHEATIQDGREEMAFAKAHSTFAQAIGVGRTAGAAATLLTHFSQRYPKLPRLKRRWKGESGGGPNMKAGADRLMVEEEEEEANAPVAAVDGAGARSGAGLGEEDDDAILNAMNDAEQAGIVKVASAGQAEASEEQPDGQGQQQQSQWWEQEDGDGSGDGMILAMSFDLASYHVPELWKMERYVPALELLFDADEEEHGEGEEMGEEQRSD